MAKELRLRRGTTAQHSTFTGANGEVTVDTTKKTVVVHDGATAGGVPLATEASVTSLSAGKQNADAELTTLAGMSADRATFLAGTQGFGFRNRIINGDMRIDQRNAGASVTVSSLVYTLDRWASFASGGSVSVQRVSGSASGFQNAVQITGGSGVTQAQFYQRIESNNCWDLASSPVTLSFTASSSSLTLISAYFGAPTSGAADNWSSGATLISQSGVTISSTPTRYTITTTLNAAAANGLQVMFFTPAFTSGTLTITGVQLEAGPVATPFERRAYGTELQLCQRYYYRTADDGSSTNLISGSVEGASIAGSGGSFPVQMRAVPTMAMGSGVRVYSFATGAQTTSIVGNRCSTTTMAGAFSISGATGGQGATVYRNTSSGFLEFSAEL